MFLREADLLMSPFVPEYLKSSCLSNFPSPSDELCGDDMFDDTLGREGGRHGAQPSGILPPDVPRKRQGQILQNADSDQG